MINENDKYGYKAYNPGLVCLGYQYEEGKTYKKNGHGICCPGVTHYCVNPFDVLDYYPLVNDDGKLSDITTVKAIDDPVTDDGKKFATSTIKIGAKLGLDGFIKACADFLSKKAIKEASDFIHINNSDEHFNFGDSEGYINIGNSGELVNISGSGECANISNSGEFVNISSSGDFPKIVNSGENTEITSSGDFAQIANSGDYTKIISSSFKGQIANSGNSVIINNSGYQARIFSSGKSACIINSGNYAKIISSGANSVCKATGINNRVKAALGNWITLTEWVFDTEEEQYIPICVKSAQIDGEKLKPDTWYTLENGEFTEVDND